MFKEMFKERVLLVDVLAIVFGISSWIEVNGVWVETPILVQSLPEQWNLASYIVLITQLANVGPIVYSILKFKSTLESIETFAIHSVLFLGTIACLLLSLFWDQITQINDSRHSVTFLALTALLALTDCTSSVLYMPFMAHFKSKYLMSFLIGQGLSGFIPSVVAIIQGIGGNPTCVVTHGNQTVPEYPEPRFTVSVFFVFLFGLGLLSWFAFILLNHLKCCQTERVSDKKSEVLMKHMSADTEPNVSSIDNELAFESTSRKTTEQNITKKSYIVVLITQAYICALTNGVLPSIQSYSCLPYGNTTYHLTVTLSAMANPIACFVAIYVSAETVKRTLPVIVGLGTVCAVYITTVAVMSPSPPLQDSPVGGLLIIVIWIAFAGLFSYSRACIASILRNTSTGHKFLFFCGVFTQIGSTFGAIFIFILINFTNIFVSYFVCN